MQPVRPATKPKRPNRHRFVDCARVRQVVGRADQRAHESQHHAAGSLNRGHSGGQRARPSRRRDRERASAGSCRSPSDIGERVHPHVLQLDRVIPVLGIGHRNYLRTAFQIDPGAPVERVDVRPDRLRPCIGNPRGHGEPVERDPVGNGGIEVKAKEHQREAPDRRLLGQRARVCCSHGRAIAQSQRG